MSKDLELIRSFLRIKAVDLEDELELLAEKEEVLDIIFNKKVCLDLIDGSYDCHAYNRVAKTREVVLLTERDFNKIKHLWDTLNKH